MKKQVQSQAPEARAMLEKAMLASNAQYIARTEMKGKTPKLDDDGLQSDIKTGLTVIRGLNDASMDKLISHYQIDMGAVADRFAHPDTKNIMRVSQFLGFLASEDARFLVGSAKTALLYFATAMLGARNRAGVMFTLTGKAHGAGDRDTGFDHPAYERAHKLVLMLNEGRNMLASTALRQVEVAAGNGGILPSLGLCEPMPRAGEVPTIKDTRVSRALVAMIESATDSTMEIWAQSGKSKKGSKK